MILYRFSIYMNDFLTKSIKKLNRRFLNNLNRKRTNVRVRLGFWDGDVGKEA